VAAGRRWRSLVLGLILSVSSVAAADSQPAFGFDWPALVAQTRGTSGIDTARLVNQRVNRLQRISDRSNWQLEDYWATPRELFTRGGGDCEDFAIAKFYLLRAHGASAAQLKLVFARYLNPANLAIQAHLVLLYQPSPDTPPLVLDNLRGEILPLASRRDLVPTAAFTEDTAWIHRADGWLRTGPAAGIRGWSALQSRWSRQQAGGVLIADAAPL
jgi:predicted transglutaminase-like cysteine proteinase